MNAHSVISIVERLAKREIEVNLRLRQECSVSSTLLNIYLHTVIKEQVTNLQFCTVTHDLN